MPDNSTDNTLRVIVQRYPNPDIIEFNTDRPLAYSHDTQDFRFKNGKVEIASMIEPQESEPFAQALAEHIFAIPGIVSDFNGGVGIERYEIRVHKAKAFSQDAIEAQVLEILSEAFGGVRLDVQRVGPNDPLRNNVSHEGEPGYTDPDPERDFDS